MNSQESFRLEWEVDGNTLPLRAIIDSEGNTIIVGDIGKPESNYDRDAFIFKMKPDGSFIYNRVTEVADSSIYFDNVIQTLNGDYLAFGNRGITDFSTPEKQDYLITAIFSKELDLLELNEFEINEDYKQIGTFALTLDATNNIIGVASAEKKIGNPSLDLALFRFTEEGDTIESKYLSFQRAVTVYDLDKIPQSDNYLLLEFNTQLHGLFECLILSPDLEVLDVNYCSSPGMHIQDHLTCDYWYPDGKFLAASTLSFGSKSDRGLGVYKCDTLANIHEYTFLNKTGVYDHNAYRQCMSYADESSIYIAGFTSDYVDCYGPDSVELYVVDTGLNQVAYKSLGGEYSYDIFGVLTSKDKGAVVYGRTYYPEIDCHSNLVIYYVSRDELGLPPVKVLDLENPSAIPWVYPNPAKRHINIQVDKQKITASSRIRIFNSKGKKVYDYKLPHQGNILQLNIENLEAGIYFFEVVCKENFTTNGKFIKQ